MNKFIIVLVSTMICWAFIGGYNYWSKNKVWAHAKEVVKSEIFTKNTERPSIINAKVKETIKEIKKVNKKSKTYKKCRATKTLKGGLKWINIAITHFLSKGRTCEWAVAKAWSLIQESWMDSRVWGDNHTSFGLAQWNGVRLKNLATHCKKVDDFWCQLDFLTKEVEKSPFYRYTKK